MSKPQDPDQTLPAEIVASNHAILGDMPYSADWIVAQARRSLGEHKRTGIELGMYCKLLRDNEPHGRYMGALQEIGIPHRTAYRYIERAEFLVANQQICQLADLSSTKIDKLAALPEATLSSLVDEDGKIAGIEPADIEQMTGAEFAAVLTQFTDALSAARDDLAEANREIGRQQVQLDAATDRYEELARAVNETAPFPAIVMRARGESAHLADRALDALTRMEKHTAALMAGEDLSPDPATRDAQIAAGIAPLYVQIGAVVSVAQRLLGLVESEFDAVYLPASVADVTPLTREELDRVRARRELMTAQEDAAEAGREQARLESGAVKRGRGRPKKAGAKAQA